MLSHPRGDDHHGKRVRSGRPQRLSSRPTLTKTTKKSFPRIRALGRWTLAVLIVAGMLLANGQIMHKLLVTPN